MSKELIMQAHECNFYKELAGLKLYHGSSPFNTLRFELFKLVKELIESNRKDLSYMEPDFVKIGKKLYKNGGMQDMTDPLIWLFIPKALQGEIAVWWDGIGEWQN